MCVSFVVRGYLKYAKVRLKKFTICSRRAQPKYDRHHRWMKPNCRRLWYVKVAARLAAVVRLSEAKSAWNSEARYGIWRT